MSYVYCNSRCFILGSVIGLVDDSFIAAAKREHLAFNLQDTNTTTYISMASSAMRLALVLALDGVGADLAAALGLTTVSVCTL